MYLFDSYPEALECNAKARDCLKLINKYIIKGNWDLAQALMCSNKDSKTSGTYLRQSIYLQAKAMQLFKFLNETRSYSAATSVSSTHPIVTETNDCVPVLLEVRCILLNPVYY